MFLNVLLPWFPIVLSAAVGARLVGKRVAFWLGISCAIYFALIVQMSTGIFFWEDAATGSVMLAGAATVLALTEWSARHGARLESRSAKRAVEHSFSNEKLAENRVIPNLNETLEQFDNWLEVNRSNSDPWPAFDEFVRHLLYRRCGARHIRSYRILGESEGLAPLWTASTTGSPNTNSLIQSTRTGIVGYVTTTGRSYHESDVMNDGPLKALASSSDESPSWCFAIRQGHRTIGVVSVGELGEVPSPVEAHVPGFESSRQATGVELRIWERIICQFWTQLTEVCRGRAAVTIDPESKLMTRSAFIEESIRVAEQSYSQGEPLAVCVLAVEGLRTLLDRGRWDLAEDIVGELGKTIRERMRPGDLAGRFDYGRFLLLLRRVDSELASLIATQLANRVAGLPASQIGIDPHQWAIGTRCGVAGTGSRSPSVQELTKRAVSLCNTARKRGAEVITDVSVASDSRGGKKKRGEQAVSSIQETA